MVNINFQSFPFLTTKRLVLRNIEDSDSKEIFALLSNKNVASFFQRPYAKSEKDAFKYINKVAEGIKAEQWIIWALSLPRNKRLIGNICIWNISHAECSAEISYELLPEYQNKGYMKEAVSKVLNYAFMNMKLNIIEARTSVKNERSINLLSKLNFKKQSVTPIDFDPLGWDNPEYVTYRISRTKYIGDILLS